METKQPLQAEDLFSATIFLQHPRRAEDLSWVQIFLSLSSQMGLGGISSSGVIFSAHHAEW